MAEQRHKLYLKVFLMVDSVENVAACGSLHELNLPPLRVPWGGQAHPAGRKQQTRRYSTEPYGGKSIINQCQKPNSGDFMEKTSSTAVAKGNKVTVEYTGMLEDGTVFDSTKGKEPISFIVGKGEVIKGFDDAVVGMKKGEQKKITITQDQGYGPRDEKLIQKVPRTVFPAEMKLEKGMGFSFKTPTGQMIHATIAEADLINVNLDMNHPLSGRTLVFELKVTEIA
jgi:peptidylprolyl isomerase